MLEIQIGRPRCRSWIPLYTQQLRLRHLVQVIGYNFKLDKHDLYFTLHHTIMSSPVYTSEVVHSKNPKWAELNSTALQNSSALGFVLRIWKKTEKEEDEILLTIGVHLSGLVYLGPKLSEIQPNAFLDDSVILQLQGGYFSNLSCLNKGLQRSLPFIDSLNVLSDEFRTCIVRYLNIDCPKNEVRCGYSLEKLVRLQNLQKTIKNKILDCEDLRREINMKSGLNFGNENIQKHEKQFQKYEILKLKKIIEVRKFRNKLLSVEKDRKLGIIRALNQKCNNLLECCDDKNTELMSMYRHLSRDIEKLKKFKKDLTDLNELYLHTTAQLSFRRRQLLRQLLIIYPIEKISGISGGYAITGVGLPDSERLREASSDTALSVALGYAAHAILMASNFLQVPLRYPLVHNGARSRIVDHITVNIPDRDREFPLYTKGKDRLQFHYAIYLLNKNISQLRWYLNMPTSDLRATLPNLLALLLADIHRPPITSHVTTFGSTSNLSEYSLKPKSRLTSSFHSSSLDNFPLPNDRQTAPRVSRSLETTSQGTSNGRTAFLDHWFRTAGHVCLQDNVCPEFFGTADRRAPIFIDVNTVKDQNNLGTNEKKTDTECFEATGLVSGSSEVTNNQILNTECCKTTESSKTNENCTCESDKEIVVVSGSRNSQSSWKKIPDNFETEFVSDGLNFTSVNVLKRLNSSENNSQCLESTSLNNNKNVGTTEKIPVGFCIETTGLNSDAGTVAAGSTDNLYCFAKTNKMTVSDCFEATGLICDSSKTNNMGNVVRSYAAAENSTGLLISNGDISYSSEQICDIQGGNLSTCDAECNTLASVDKEENNSKVFEVIETKLNSFDISGIKEDVNILDEEGIICKTINIKPHITRADILGGDRNFILGTTEQKSNFLAPDLKGDTSSASVSEDDAPEEDLVSRAAALAGKTASFHLVRHQH